jgi:hypothetical protein
MSYTEDVFRIALVAQLEMTLIFELIRSFVHLEQARTEITRSEMHFHFEMHILHKILVPSKIMTPSLPSKDLPGMTRSTALRISFE